MSSSTPAPLAVPPGAPGGGGGMAMPNLANPSGLSGMPLPVPLLNGGAEIFIFDGIVPKLEDEKYKHIWEILLCFLGVRSPRFFVWLGGWGGGGNIWGWSHDAKLVVLVGWSCLVIGMVKPPN